MEHNPHNHDRYLNPSYSSPKSPYQSPGTGKTSPIAMSMGRSSSYDPHRVLGYFDIPSRSAPSSPQSSSLPYTPVSRSSSPAREDVRRSKDFNSLSRHGGSDFDDALHGFSLVPHWLKIAMEKHVPVESVMKVRPSSSLQSPNESAPTNGRPVSLVVDIPQKETHPPSSEASSKTVSAEDEDRRYWEEEEEDGSYLATMEDDDEDLEECYRSVL
jgi:hypothetical protein